MVVPAFFMGLAFPLAGKVHVECRKVVGGAVGEVLAYNTLGAIFGSAISGFLMIRLFGIERSLQMLTLFNIGIGLFVLFSLRQIKSLRWIISGLILSALLLLGLDQNVFRTWDKKYFAVFRSNQLGAFDTPEKVKFAIENTDVLYYAEGTESIVSSYRVKGGEQSFSANGRTEASSHLRDQQCQFALCHLPMLLHKNPKRVLVVGLGSGMTLGGTSVHPSVEKLILVEIEPKVVNVAKTFEKYNHHVLDDPKLKIVFNDGRNFLMTTREKFDVITADPIHPWSQGAGYLYTAEYFKLVAEHLLPGGIACQWLPIYELAPEDLKSVVVTFRQNFKYTMMWLTNSDALIIGSNSPIVMDEEEMDRRIAQPEISEDLNRVMMGNATDFLSYFVMGNDGMKAFSEGGIINTDDNLYIEFHAPFSISEDSMMGENINAIIKYRESILPYLIAAQGKTARAAQERRWSDHPEAVDVAGRAVALFWEERFREAQFQKLIDELSTKYPSFAPGRFLKHEYMAAQGPTKELQKTELAVIDENGLQTVVEISAVFVPVSSEQGAVVFIDNNTRVIYGELYVWGRNRDKFINQFVIEVMTDIRAVYRKEVEGVLKQKRELPLAGPTLQKIRELIGNKIKKGNQS
jgi:spermidine synthase